MDKKEKKAAYDKIYYKKNKARKDALNKKWLDANREKMNQCNRKNKRKYRERNKLGAMIHYSGNPPSCLCCGESHIQFLTLDHKNGDGARHRKELKVGEYEKGRGANIYVWVKRNNYPEIFDVLCFNCNVGRGENGICPHKIL